MAHLDLKPDNIVIDDDGNLVLIDFETLQPLNKGINVPFGTERYFAPEIHHLNSYGQPYYGGPCDIFNIGITIFMMSFSNYPFD